MSPQWGSNSKAERKIVHLFELWTGFSPLNGEVILKLPLIRLKQTGKLFQSPQWGSNSKERIKKYKHQIPKFQSPQWGSNSKDRTPKGASWMNGFQSPQWGSNSKALRMDYYQI